jgi:hypothetical protein
VATVPLRRGLAAAALALCAVAGEAAELATLFHTPEERARLDRLRRGDPETTATAHAAAPTVTGFVRRSDGRHTVWIDGTPVPVARPGADALLDPRAMPPRGAEDLLKIERKPPR